MDLSSDQTGPASHKGFLSDHSAIFSLLSNQQKTKTKYDKRKQKNKLKKESKWKARPPTPSGISYLSET
jgi:hypothetical protein